MTTTAYIALGSNVGDRSAILASAVRAIGDLEGVHLLRASSIIETAPAGPVGDGRAAGGPYLNAVVAVRTALLPRELLNRCLEVERQHGRRRTPGERWAPRTLDLDLILYGKNVINEPGLCIPHPRLHEREFVLRPLAEIAPNLIHPTLEQTVQCLLRGL